MAGVDSLGVSFHWGWAWTVSTENLWFLFTKGCDQLILDGVWLATGTTRHS